MVFASMSCGSPEHNDGLPLAAWWVVGRANPPARENSLDCHTGRDQSASRESFDRSEDSAFLEGKASPFDIAGDAGREYAILSALTEAAPARKFKYSKGLNCHYTFWIGAVLFQCDSPWDEPWSGCGAKAPKESSKKQSVTADSCIGGAEAGYKA
jgi:hypothetical protein